MKAGEKVNTMTIGWGNIGFIWNKPIMMVPVRYSRYTYSMIDGSDTFTVSVPVQSDMKKELAFVAQNLDGTWTKFRPVA